MGLCHCKGLRQKNKTSEILRDSIQPSTQTNEIFKSSSTEMTTLEEMPITSAASIGETNVAPDPPLSTDTILTENTANAATTSVMPNSARNGKDVCSIPSHEKKNTEKPTSTLIKRSLPSAIGLDTMIEERREAGELKTNVVRLEVPFGKPIEEVYCGVHDGPILGSGISGVVRMVTHRATGVKYAVKSLDLGLIETADGLHQLREEIFIMCQLDHPNIVRLEEVYESRSEIYLVQELCLGGELFDRLDEQPDYHYTERQCARIIKQLLSAVRYIHSKGIVHRDLKLENFLFSTTSPDSELKLIDFGLSKHFTLGQQHFEPVGTPYTVAPEVIRGNYDEKCDVWAIGVITYLLLSGDPPFGGCGGPEPPAVVRQNILSGSFLFEPQDIWERVSPLAKQFISSLLVTNPRHRPSAEVAQQSVWLQEWSNSELKANGGLSLNPNVVKALVSFKEYSDMRKLLCQVLSFTLLPNQIENLRKEFEKFDTEGRGEISLASLKQVLLHSAGSRSLGSLSEGEVEDIFNAMRVRKTDTTIQWHEFIAAGLSQCDYDDRNLRLAFDRLDSDRKGYISYDDVLDLMGSSGTEEFVRAMFQDSLHFCRSKHARLSYDDFLLLMKGQTYEDARLVRQAPVPHSPVISHRRGISLDNLDESFSLGGKSIAETSLEPIPSVKSGECESFLDSKERLPLGKANISIAIQSPSADSNTIMPVPSSDMIKSLNEEVSAMDRTILSSIDTVNKSALVANRDLYRSYRRMRLAVMEASKRFEENQILRTKMKLQQESNNRLESTIVSKQCVTAGLTMRHGSLIREDSGIVRDFMEEKEREREEQLKQAYKRAGRGGGTRNKTISDMSTMMTLLFPTGPANPAPANDASLGDKNEDAATLLNISSNANTWSGPVSKVCVVGVTARACLKYD